MRCPCALQRQIPRRANSPDSLLGPAKDAMRLNPVVEQTPAPSVGRTVVTAWPLTVMARVVVAVCESCGGDGEGGGD